jgi:hypothetical protein
MIINTSLKYVSHPNNATSDAGTTNNGHLHTFPTIEGQGLQCLLTIWCLNNQYKAIAMLDILWLHLTWLVHDIPQVHQL